MTEKEQFIDKMKARTKQFAVDVIGFVETLEKCQGTSVISYQIIKSATSTGANYLTDCKARSKNEFFSKVCIVAEEIDKSEYWLEFIKDAKLSMDKKELDKLLIEANELNKIMNKAKNSTFEK